ATNALRFIHEGLRIAFRHSFAIALLPAFAFPAWSAITFVQSNYSTPQSSQTSVSVTFTAAQTAGDLNMIVVGWNDSSAHVASVTDKSGNVYTLAVGPTVQSGVASQSIYYAKNIVAATAKTNIVTVTFSRSAAYPDIRILEYSGADPNNPVDVAGAGTGSSSTSSASATTTNVADLVFAANLVQTMTTGAGNGFTKRLITSPDGDIAEDMMAASAGTYTATAPLSSGQWIMQMVALRAVSNGLTTTYSISGKVSGSAATVALSGTSSATTTVAAGGTYTFSGLKNGSYTVTPTQSGYTFSPASASVTVNGANVSGVNFTGSVITAGTYSISGKVTGSAATVALSGTS